MPLSFVPPNVNPEYYPGLGAIYAALVSAVFTLFAAFWVASRYTKRTKAVEATLSFGRQYHELLQYRNELNNKFYYENNGSLKVNPVATVKQLENAWFFFYQLFDLLLHEYYHYRENLVEKYAFAEWMIWRRHDYNPPAAAPGVVLPPTRHLGTCGLTYAAAWDQWRLISAVRRNPFVDFLDRVHRAQSDDEVRSIVKGRWRLFWERGVPLLVAAVIGAFITLVIGVPLLGYEPKQQNVIESISEDDKNQLLRFGESKDPVIAICMVHLWHELGLLSDVFVKKYDQAAKQVFGITDVQASCKNSKDKVKDNDNINGQLDLAPVEIDFAEGHSDVAPAGRKKIADAAARWSKNGITAVTAEGFASPTGTAAVNFKFQERAGAVGGGIFRKQRNPRDRHQARVADIAQYSTHRQGDGFGHPATRRTQS
jgi:outer membrane protein OmpA-like peptidoglycan-associated protein